MSKTTPVLILLCLLLAVGVIATTKQLRASSDVPSLPDLAKNIKFGLAQAMPNTDDRRFRAVSAILWDTKEHKILFQQNAFERRPLASITKLMTAMVAIDYGIKWEQPANIQPNEYGVGGQLQLFSGETVSMKDLVNASLVGSANNATLAYVRQLGISKDDFITAMNRKAVSLGLEQTEFQDVTGLEVGNVSNAYEIARLAEEAFTAYPEISEITSQKEYSFVVSGSGREHTIRNTDKLVSENNLEVTGSKTGFLYETQYCLVIKGSGKYADRVAVVLGSPSEEENFADVARLLTMDVAP
jgi:D-alanyl-D-alanine carboxypeptidase